MVGKFLSISVVNAVFPGFVGTQEKDVICSNLNFAPVYSGLQSKYILLSILLDSSHPRNKSSKLYIVCDITKQVCFHLLSWLNWASRSYQDLLLLSSIFVAHLSLSHLCPWFGVQAWQYMCFLAHPAYLRMPLTSGMYYPERFFSETWFFPALSLHAH